MGKPRVMPSSRKNSTDPKQSEVDLLRDPALWLSDRPVWISVMGDSMEPLLRTGDRIQVQAAEYGDFLSGDLIVFKNGPEITIHRLLRADGLGFLEMGDNRARGVGHPWPGRVGRAVRLERAGEELDLRSTPARTAARRAARRSLLRHRLEALSGWLPGRILPGGLRRVSRLFFRWIWRDPCRRFAAAGQGTRGSSTDYADCTDLKREKSREDNQ